MQLIRKTWESGPTMITYLSPYEECIPAMAIEVPLVLRLEFMLSELIDGRTL